MNTLLQKTKLLFRQLRGFFPSPVPQGMTEFEDWAKSIVDTYPIGADFDSVRFALSAMIINSGPQAAYRSKFAFFLMLRAGMAKQIAGAVFQDIKQRQQAQKAAALAAEKARQLAEATANSQVVSDVLQPLQN